jgi:hypothetical protein
MALIRVLPEPSIAQASERSADIQIPKHLPIKVRIKKLKEDSFRNLGNDKWLSEFELEVENTGAKPIYFLQLMVIFPDSLNSLGSIPKFPVFYGDPRLGRIENLAEETDVPIKPGEVQTFTIHPSQVRAWESAVRDEGQKQPSRVEIIFQILNFGNQTGFVGQDGQAVPRSAEALGRCQPPLEPSATKDSWQSLSGGLDKPASMVPVNFLSGGEAKAIPEVVSDCCQSVPDCDYMLVEFANWCVNCPPQNRIYNVSCSYPFATCAQISTKNEDQWH